MKKREIIFVLIFLSIFLIRYYFALSPKSLPADIYVGREVVSTGIIVDEPDLRDTNTKYILRLGKELDDVKVLITADRFPRFYYGDRLEFRGVIEFPKSFENDLGIVFDYPKYLAKDNIRYVSFRPEITLLEKNKGSKFFTLLFSFKKKFVQNIEKALPEPHASLGSGVTLGLKQSLGSDLLESFRTAGIIHIVVLSGYNMTIILSGVLYFFSRFGRAVSLVLSAAFVLIFAAMVGFESTVLRALFMALLALLARFLGRPVIALRALFIAGIAMLLWNPVILFHDPSFQLSFLATFGLIVVSPFIERKISFIRAKSNWQKILKEIFVSTISVQVFVLPALIYMTGKFSLISLPVNLLVLPLVPTAMFFTSFSAMVGFVSIFIARVLSLPAYLIFDFIIKISELSAKIPFASLNLGAVPLPVVFAIYILYGFFLWREKKKIISESV